MDVDKKAVGMRIKSLRKEKGLTLEEFGKMVLNAGKSNVSKWERGLTIPSNERLKVISEIGNTSTDYLLYGSFKDFFLRNYKEFFPVEEIDTLPIISVNWLTDIINKLVKEDTKIYEYEKISRTVSDSLPKLKIEFEKEVDNYLRYITQHKQYEKEVIEYAKNEFLNQDQTDLREISSFFHNGPDISFHEKVEKFNLIQGTFDSLELIVNRSGYYTDTFAYTSTMDFFLENYGNLDWANKNLEPRRNIYYKRGFKPFPSNLNRHDILVQIDSDINCFQLLSNPSLLLYCFDDLSFELLSEHFKETQVTIIHNESIYTGFLNSELTFKTYTLEGLLEIKIDNDFNFKSIFPTAAIYY